MKKTKICFVTREYAHERMGKTGGIGVFLKQYTEQLKKHDYDITIFSYGPNPVRFKEDGITVVRIEDFTGFNERIKSPLRKHHVPGYITIKMILEYLNRTYISFYLSVFVYKEKFDLIEFHDYGGDAPYFMGKLPKIVRCHGSALTLHQFMGYVSRKSDSVFEKQFFKRFDKNVIAVSEYSANTTQEAFGLNIKPKVIYNGVRIPEIDKKESYMDFPTIPFSLFYFGSVRERKGIDIACHVFNSIIEKFPKATFHVLGNNNNNHWEEVSLSILTKKASLQATYYGSVPHSEITNFLVRAHVIIFPSYGENFSIGLLEALALGKIVVTSNISAFKEIIEDKTNGYIAKEDKEYVNLISKIFQLEEAPEVMSNKAKSTIFNKFNLESKIDENVNYYRSLLYKNLEA